MYIFYMHYAMLFIIVIMVGVGRNRKFEKILKHKKSQWIRKIIFVWMICNEDNNNNNNIYAIVCSYAIRICFVRIFWVWSLQWYAILNASRICISKISNIEWEIVLDRELKNQRSHTMDSCYWEKISLFLRDHRTYESKRTKWIQK